uniref:Uncharacterized protein n=1 Tax=Arundo donax TaxID=35708 RepID=A0A0A8Z4D3_ARUDO
MWQMEEVRWRTRKGREGE